MTPDSLVNACRAVAVGTALLVPMVVRHPAGLTAVSPRARLVFASLACKPVRATNRSAIDTLARRANSRDEHDS